MVEATIFVPLAIVAATQIIKMAFPQVSGWVTILVAMVVGVVAALIDGAIGVTDITVAQGLLFAFEAVGVATLASKAGGGAKGDQ